MGQKKWYKSRTVWANLIALFSALVAHLTGVEVSAEEAVALLAVVNLGLRIITKTELTI
jgi:hypothetical protein